MQHFLLFYDLVDDYLERRHAYRAEHFALARAASERGELRYGGAFADPANGAVLCFRADERSVVEAFAKADPYVLNGLVKDWRVRAWTVVIGADYRAE